MNKAGSNKKSISMKRCLTGIVLFVGLCTVNIAFSCQNIGLACTKKSDCCSGNCGSGFCKAPQCSNQFCQCEPSDQNQMKSSISLCESLNPVDCEVHGAPQNCATFCNELYAPDCPWHNFHFGCVTKSWKSIGSFLADVSPRLVNTIS